MFKTSEELKAFILWAKNNGVQQVSAGKVTVVFSDYAVAAAVLDNSPVPETRHNTEHKDTSRTLVDIAPEDDKEDEELLYASAR